MKDTGERLIAKYHLNDLIYGEHIARYLLSAEISKGKTVLDIASGTGYGTNLIAEKAKRVVGVDISKNAVEYAQKNYPAKNIEFMQGSADNVPQKDNSFDIVNSFETIEHISTYKEFIKEAKRVLKPNGLFIVSTPNKKEFVENNHFHVHEFTEEEFRKVLKASFKNVEFYYQEAYKGTSIHKAVDFSKVWQKKELVYKSLNQPKEKAIYYVALCSDYKLPDYGSINVISENWSDKAYQHLQEYLDKQLKENAKLKEEKREYTRQIKSLTESRSWKITKPLRSAKRLMKKKK